MCQIWSLGLTSDSLYISWCFHLSSLWWPLEMPFHCSISLLFQFAPFQPILTSLGLWRHEIFSTVFVLLIGFHLWQFCVWLCQFFNVLLCVTNGSVSEPTNLFVYMKVLCWIWNHLSHFSDHIMVFFLLCFFMYGTYLLDFLRFIMPLFE